MAKKKQSKRRLSPTIKERRRILGHVENLRDHIGEETYSLLVNRITGGEEPDDPSYRRDRGGMP